MANYNYKTSSVAWHPMPFCIWLHIFLVASFSAPLSAFVTHLPFLWQAVHPCVIASNPSTLLLHRSCIFQNLAQMPPLPWCQLPYFPLTLISIIFLLLSYLWCTLLGYLVTDVSRQCVPQLCILTLAHIGVANRSSENKVSFMENSTKQSQHDFPLKALQGTSRHYFFIKLLLITAPGSY